MSVQQDIDAYIASQTGAKRTDMQELHRSMLKLMPKAQLWFLNSKDEKARWFPTPTSGTACVPSSTPMARPKSSTRSASAATPQESLSTSWG